MDVRAKQAEAINDQGHENIGDDGESSERSGTHLSHER
jgi:hypothetical protein